MFLPNHCDCFVDAVLISAVDNDLRSSAANPAPMATPMPAVEPVTNATLFISCKSITYPLKLCAAIDNACRIGRLCAFNLRRQARAIVCFNRRRNVPDSGGDISGTRICRDYQQQDTASRHRTEMRNNIANKDRLVLIVSLLFTFQTKEVEVGSHTHRMIGQ